MFKYFFFPFLLISFGITLKAQDEAKLDSLRDELHSVFMKDQTFRLIYTEAEVKLGKDSDEMEYFWEVVEAEDRVLEKQVSEIIDKYGWLGISQVGRRANTAIWGVMQHGSVASKEKYGPLMKESVLKGESQARQYAMLIDRMLFNSDKLLRYGTMINYQSGDTPVFYKVENPKGINERRKEIGLGTIEEFAKQRGVKWSYN